MSQNRTVIQGMEGADNFGRGNYGGKSNFYQPQNPSGGAKGTYVPGMESEPGSNNFSQTTAQTQQEAHKHFSSGKPVVGFLYSVSRTAAGEYWPLHLGQNTIGKDSSRDIVLSEGTVSNDHAVIVVRKLKNTDKIIASISDTRSTNGTMLNGVSLEFSAVECHNNDIITVGDNYELLLLLVDPASLGLAVNKNFIPIEEEDDEIPAPPIGTTKPFGGTNFYGSGPVPPSYSGGYNPGGTKGMDGTGGFSKGGTTGM